MAAPVRWKYSRMPHTARVQTREVTPTTLARYKHHLRATASETARTTGALALQATSDLCGAGCGLDGSNPSPVSAAISATRLVGKLALPEAGPVRARLWHHRYSTRYYHGSISATLAGNLYMPTVSVKLAEETKLRLNRLAASNGITSHAFMVDAIESALSNAENHSVFFCGCAALSQASLCLGATD